MTILINKISGLFGILAIFTGMHLSTLQFTMYLYSLAAFILTLYLYSHIRRQSPLQCLTLAYFYVIDSIINALYTAAFAIAWFWVLAAHPEDSANAPGTGTISDAAGFTSPEFNVSHVEVHPVAGSGLTAAEQAVTFGKGTADGSAAGLGSALFQSGSIASITIIASLWIVRVYFIFVMLAYARSVLRQHIATTSEPAAAWLSQNPADQTSLAENPFSELREEGMGWRGKLGRSMLKVAPQYWLGADEDREWMRSMGGRFNRKTVGTEPAGVFERERRRRSGTGPPVPTIALPRFVGQEEPR
jgi:inositol phosphorylceramide synthase regulatory subunit